MGSARLRFWFLAAGGTLIDGFSIFTLGVALPLMALELGFSAFVTGLVGSALVLGAAIGALVGGEAADRFGRKAAFLADMAILVSGAVLSAAARDVTLVLLGQFLVGIGIGIDFPTSGSYVSEIAPRRARSRMVVATIALQSLGMLLGAAVSVLLLRRGDDPSVWRIILAATGALALLFLVLRLGMPESPRWLIEHGADAAAEGAVARMVPTSFVATTQPAPPVVAPPIAAPNEPAGVAALFTREYRLRTLLVSVPWFLMDIATYGVGLFTPVILAAMHFGAGPPGSLAAEVADARGSGMIDLFLLIGFLLSLWAVPRFGRIHMQVVGFVGMTLGMLGLLYASLADGGPAAHLPLVFAGFILFNLAMNAGPNATTFTLGPELFPTALRAVASGFAAATAKLGATLGTFVLPLVKAEFGVAGVVGLLAGVAALGAVVTFAFATEVHEGKRLEEAGTRPM